MLGNLINRHDAVRLYRRLRQGHLQQIAAKVRTPGRSGLRALSLGCGSGDQEIAWALGPGGLLIMDEYVGPSRFQWGGVQIRAADALLAALPEQQRIQRDGRIKRRVVRPSRLSMRLDDPSEAAESSDLMPALHQRFAVLEEHPYGSILHRRPAMCGYDVA